MKQTTLSKIKDQAKLKIDFWSNTVYTKQSVVKIDGKKMALITSDSSGRTYKRSVKLSCWDCSNISAVDNVIRYKKKVAKNYKK